MQTAGANVLFHGQDADVTIRGLWQEPNASLTTLFCLRFHLHFLSYELLPKHLLREGTLSQFYELAT